MGVIGRQATGGNHAVDVDDGLPLALDDPRLLALVRELRPVIVLDTAIRFSTAKEENSATENNRGLARGCFELRREGARGIIGLHHSPKAAAGKRMTLQNVLAGTRDVGAMCDAVYGIRCENYETLDLRIQCVKPRDFEPVAPFNVQGKPFINERNDFGVLIESGRPAGEAELAAITQAIGANPDITYRDLAAIAGISKTRLERLTAKAGFQKLGKRWARQGGQT